MGHVVAVVHSEYEGAVGVRVGDVGEGGRCQWTAVTAKTEEEVQKSRQTLAAG